MRPLMPAKSMREKKLQVHWLRELKVCSDVEQTVRQAKDEHEEFKIF